MQRPSPPRVPTNHELWQATAALDRRCATPLLTFPCANISQNAQRRLWLAAVQHRAARRQLPTLVRMGL